MSQIKSRPPTFYTYVNDKELFKENYFKRLSAALAKEFNMEGVPIRLIIRD
jgi:predicted GTPase